MKNRKGYNLMLSIAAVLLCLTLFTTYLVSGMYAKYAVTNEMGDSARIAKFVFDVKTSTNEEVELNQIEKPGDTQKINLIIKNNKNEIASEVTEKGIISIKYIGSMPLVIKLMDGIKEIAALDAKDITEDNPELSDGYDEITLLAAVETSKAYELIIKWPAEENDIKYANAATCGKITLSVSGEQID